MTAVGAAAVAAVWGWFTVSVLRHDWSPVGVAAGAAASAAVLLEALLVAGTAAAVAAGAGLVIGAAGYAVWLRALRAHEVRAQGAPR